METRKGRKQNKTTTIAALCIFCLPLLLSANAARAYDDEAQQPKTKHKTKARTHRAAEAPLTDDQKTFNDALSSPQQKHVFRGLNENEKAAMMQIWKKNGIDKGSSEEKAF